MVVLWHFDKLIMQGKLIKNSIVQGGITILAFLVIWFSLSQINWIGIAKINQLSAQAEQKIGDIIWEMQTRAENELTDIEFTKPVDSILNHICKKNSIDRNKLKIHVFQNDEVNAFAMPNGHIVLYSGLILNTNNSDELTGVICHELAHIQLNHVMKKLIQEIGFSVLISTTTGNRNTEIIKKTLKTLSSTAFDRSQERDADLKAVDYMIKSNVDPKPFANFLFKLADEEHEMEKYLTWISTHPDSKERAESIIDYSKTFEINKQSILQQQTWMKLKENLKKVTQID